MTGHIVALTSFFPVYYLTYKFIPNIKLRIACSFLVNVLLLYVELLVLAEDPLAFLFLYIYPWYFLTMSLTIELVIYIVRRRQQQKSPPNCR